MEGFGHSLIAVHVRPVSTASPPDSQTRRVPVLQATTARNSPPSMYPNPTPSAVREDTTVPKEAPNRLGVHQPLIRPSKAALLACLVRPVFTALPKNSPPPNVPLTPSVPTARASPRSAQTGRTRLTTPPSWNQLTSACRVLSAPTANKAASSAIVTLATTAVSRTRARCQVAKMRQLEDRAQSDSTVRRELSFLNDVPVGCSSVTKEQQE